MICYGTIKNGKMELDRADLIQEWISLQHDMRIELTIEKYHPEKTHSQLKYYFGVVVKLGADEFGYSPDEMDGILCTRFLKHYTNDGRVYVKSKSELTTKEMGEFIDKCVRFLAFEGIVVPPAEKG